MLPAQPNQSLIDGLACLQALAAYREPIGSRELARTLDLDPTRVNRLLKTLAHLGLAEQDASRKYRPGPAIHVLAAESLFGSGLLRRAFGPLESLLPFGHLVAMGVLWRDRTCYLYHGGRKDPVAHGVGHPILFPAVASGLGMALLAHKPQAEVRSLYEHADSRPGALASPDPPPTLDGRHGLLAKLRHIRRQGYALVPIPDSPRRTLGVALGRPPYAAIGLSGTFANRTIPTLVTALRDVVEQIESTEENDVDHDPRARERLRSLPPSRPGG